MQQTDIFIFSGYGTPGLKQYNEKSILRFYDNSKKFETTSDGATFSGSALLPDNVRLKIGGDASNPDFQIYHDGSNTRLIEGGTGDLYLDTSGFRIRNAAGNENVAAFIQNGAVELYHDNSKKAETVSGGFTVTGVCTATSFAGDGSSLTGVSAGATGGGSDEVFYENGQTVTTSYSITSNKNAMSAGPISINNSVTVTVPSGSVWTIV